jgi:hypothetical protein
VGTLASQGDLDRLLARLARLTPDASRRWGTLTPAEMLCHLGDAGESVLGIRVPPGPSPSGRPNPIVKWLAIYSPMPWPKGVETRPGVNPHKEGTRPVDFEQDRTRVVEGLRKLATAPTDGLSKVHFRFGPMERKDWLQWAYRHVDHHMRQFGL